MEWIKEIAELTGVSVQSFLLVSGLILVVVATARYVLGKKALETKRWWKAVLTLGAMGLGIGGAFLAVTAGLYTHVNPAMTVIVGMFNGTVAIASHQVLKQIPFLDKILKAVSMVLILTCVTNCGSWLNDTRTGLLATNAGLNTYDDIAVELWKDAPTNQKAKEDLGLSACASVMVQDQIIQAWSVTTAVDHGLKKKDDITPYISTAISILDSLEDYLEMSGYPLPTELKVVWAQLEAINPGGVLAPDSEPLEVCRDVLSEKVPVAGMNVPWEAVLRSAGNLAMFLYEVITNSLEGKDVPEEALETYIRDPLKQIILYDASLGE